MSKYVIVREEDPGLGYFWCAYRSFFGLHGWATRVSGTISIRSADECEERLRKVVFKSNDVLVKEIEIK
jgi:hypothetical protein